MSLLSTSEALRCHWICCRCSGCSHCSQMIRMVGSKTRTRMNMMIDSHHNGCYTRDSSPPHSRCDDHFSVPCIVPSESLSLSL